MSWESSPDRGWCRGDHGALAGGSLSRCHRSADPSAPLKVHVTVPDTQLGSARHLVLYVMVLGGQEGPRDLPKATPKGRFSMLHIH